MSKKKDIEKLHEIVGGEIGYMGDDSGSWIELKNETHEIIFDFNGKGTELSGIQIRKRVWVEDCSKEITEFKNL